MTLHLISLAVLFGIICTVQCCSPLIEVVGIPARFDEMCTVPVVNNKITITYNVTTDKPHDPSCNQFTITSVSWSLYKYSSPDRDDSYRKSQSGSTETGVVTIKSSLSTSIYAISSYIELSNGESSQDIIVNGYFAHGVCEGSYKDFQQLLWSVRNSKCYPIYEVIEQKLSEEYDLQECGSLKNYYGDPNCVQLDTVSCHSGSEDADHCHEVDARYGRLTQIIDNECRYGDDYAIRQDGIWTQNRCKAEFEICTNITNNYNSTQGPTMDNPTADSNDTFLVEPTPTVGTTMDNPSADSNETLLVEPTPTEVRQKRKKRTLAETLDIAYSSCADVYKYNPTAQDNSYVLQNTAGELYTVYCEFYPTHIYTFIAPPELNSINIEKLYNNQAEVMIRNRHDNGTQGEATIGQIQKYSSQDISLQYNAHVGYEEIKNTNMGPYIYMGFLPLSGISHKKDTQGYSVNGQDYTFTNCDGNPNSYFVLLFNQNTEQFNNGGKASSFMTKWIDESTPVPTEHELPVEFYSQFEMHMGGCGGYLTSNQISGLTGASIGLRYDIDECMQGGHACDTNAVCANTDGSYTCTCNQGYIGDGTTCSDIDECIQGGHACDTNAVCANTDGSYTCTCNHGYIGDGATCSVSLDINLNDTNQIEDSSPVVTAGTCQVVPESGYALLTDFNITCTGFTVSDGSDLTYKMYANKDNELDDAVKVYDGNRADVYGIKLQESVPSNDHYIYIFVVASVESGVSVNFVTGVQVLPPSESESGISTIDLVSNIVIGGNETGESNQIEDLLGAGDSEAAVQLISIMSTTINSMNTSQDDSEFKEKKTEVRSAMVSNLGKVPVSDFETLTTLTTVLNDVTDDKSELSEKAQDDASNLYDNLADNFDAFLGSTSSKAQVTDTAESILKGVTGILDVVTDTGRKKLINDTDTPTQERDPVVVDIEDQQSVEKVKNSTDKLLNTLNKVSGSMLTQQVVDQPPTVIQTETVAISVQKLSSLANSTISPNDGSGNSSSSMQFDEAFPILAGDVGIKTVVMKNNPFIWDATARDVNSDVMTVDLTSAYDNSKLNVSNLTSPVLISLNIPDTSNRTQTSFDLNLIKTNNTVDYNTTESNTMTFNFTLSPSKTAVLKITPQSNITRLKVLVSDHHQPWFAEIIDKGFIYPAESHYQIQYTDFMFINENISAIIKDVNSGLMYFHYNSSSGADSTTQTIFVGMAVDINDTETMIQVEAADSTCLGDVDVGTCTSVIEVPVTLETKLLSCTYWDEVGQTWSNEGCEVSPYSTIDTLKCACSHLTSFAGGVFVLPNFVDPIGDAALFLTFFDNPVVVTAVLIVWIVYFFLVHWARRADKNDTEKVGVIYCKDNDVTHHYSYLVCVVTGWWKDAGTTANVFIYIQGKKGASPRRKLSTGARLCFQTGYEDWFLITTEESLGTIKQVTFWHDNTGTSPPWYLSQAYIQDTQTGQGWTFIYNDWLAVDRGALLQTTGTVAAVTHEQLKTKQKHNFMMKTVQGFRDGHLWISVFSKPPRSSFTRVQRLTCALSLLLTTMLTNIMFYGIPTDEAGDQVGGVGGINISLSALVIGIQSSLIMFPVNILILQLFIRVKPKLVHAIEMKKKAMSKEEEMKQKLVTVVRIKDKMMKKIQGSFKATNFRDGLKITDPSKSDADMKNLDEVEEEKSSSSTSIEGDSSTGELATPNRPVNSGGFLPWWFLYISWCFVITICLISSYFVMLYGLKYGYETSVAWIVSFLTGFTQSAFVVQPIKVICIAILMSLILKKTVQFEDIGPNVDLDKDEEYLCLTKDHKETHIPYSEPLSARLLRQIRDRLKLEWLMNAAIRDIILYVIYLAVVMLVVHGHRDIKQAYKNTVAIEDLEWLMNAAIRDIILYVIYLAVVMLVVHGHRDIKQAYKNTVAIEDVLVNPGCIKLWQCFFLEKADKVDTFYQYMHDVAIPSLADMSIADHSYATPGSSHFLLGPYRLRQLRVAKGACPGMAWLFTKFDMRLPECTGDYWLGEEDNKHYNLNWTNQLFESPSHPTLWTYQSAWKLKTIPFTGKLATYSGGGYVLTMPRDSSLHAGIIEDLWNTEWIDERTRAIFLEFTLYNPNADLFSVVMIIFEFSNSGAVIPHHQIFTTRLFHYSSDFGIFVLVCEVSFLLFNISFTYIEYKRIKKIGKKEYFSDKWSYVELLQISLSFSVIGLFFQRLLSVRGILDDYRASTGGEFVSFYTAVTWDYILGYVMGFLVCLVTLKFIKLLEFNKKMFMMSDVVSQSKGALISFTVLAVFFAIGFAHFTNMAFGKDLHGYRSMSSSLMTVFNFALGVSDLPGLQNINRILGPIYFFVFVFVVNICFLTIFMAILNFGINESKTLFEERKNKFELLDYISSKVKLLINVK